MLATSETKHSREIVRSISTSLSSLVRLLKLGLEDPHAPPLPTPLNLIFPVQCLHCFAYKLVSGSKVNGCLLSVLYFYQFVFVCWLAEF